MTRLGFGLLAGSLLLVLSLYSQTWAQGRTPAITKWEYLIERGCTWPQQERLDQLGQEGWALVAASGYGSDNGCQGLVFKRPLTKNATTAALTKPVPAPTPALACTMSLAQSPVVRGLRLGLSATEVMALLPSSKMQIENALKQQPGRRSQGMASFFLQPPANPQFASTEEQKALAQRFAPITFIEIGFYKDKVARLSVQYQINSDVPQWNAQNWIQKLAENYGLPSFESWQKPKGAEGHALTCAGFEVHIPNHYSPLVFTLSDTQAVANAKQWLADEDARLRREFKP